MVRKCCVTGCRSNYDSTNKVTVFRLPKDKDERERWMKAIPRDNIPDSPNTVVCIKHFPEGFETVSVKGKLRPKNPPSVFPDLPKSLIPTSVPKARTTCRSRSSVRSVEPDQLQEYLQQDSVSFDLLCSHIKAHTFSITEVSYQCFPYIFFFFFSQGYNCMKHNFS